MLLMKKIFLVMCLVFSAVLSASAQGMKISGSLVDRDTKEGVMLATVQMYEVKGADSTYVDGVLTDDKGFFTISVQAQGTYK